MLCDNENLLKGGGEGVLIMLPNPIMKPGVTLQYSERILLPVCTCISLIKGPILLRLDITHVVRNQKTMKVLPLGSLTTVVRNIAYQRSLLC